MIRPIWRMRVDLPPMFGPVRIMKDAESPVANRVSLGIKLSDGTHGCFPSLISMKIYDIKSYIYSPL